MAMAAIHGLELLEITPASAFTTHALAELGTLPPILQLGILGHFMNRPACWQNPSRSLVDSAEYAQRKHLVNPPPWLRGAWLANHLSLAPGARAKLDKLVSKGALEPLHRFPEGRAALDELQRLPYPLQDQTVGAALWDLQGCLDCVAQGSAGCRWRHRGDTGGPSASKEVARRLITRCSCCFCCSHQAVGALQAMVLAEVAPCWGIQPPDWSLH